MSRCAKCGCEKESPFDGKTVIHDEARCGSFVAADMVNHPPHYTSHPSGVECIQVTEHYGFCIGSAIKYLWRAGLKGDAVEDLKKAVWYINREIAKREQLNHG
jgi:hypothetical protein